MSSILIIENNAMNMEMASELLENAGHSVIKTENALDGINRAKIENPDLVLMDLSLPGMDGLSATKILKEETLTKNIPVIAFTARAMKSDKEKAFEAGCSGYISKPIETSQFVKYIESYLENITENNNRNCLRLNNLSAPLLKAFLPKQAGKEPFREKYKCHNVLIIDDKPLNTELIKEALTQINQNSFIAYSGKQALELVEKEKFDLILLDIMMPEMSGFEVIKELKAKSSTRDIPVIFISALDKTDDIVKGLVSGSDGYITKPFKTEELKARILSLLKIKDLQDQLKSEKEVLERVFQFSADGIIILNSSFQIISCNDLLAKWLFLPKKQLLNCDFYEVFGFDKEINPIKQCLSTGNKYWDFCLEIDKNKNSTDVSYFQAEKARTDAFSSFSSKEKRFLEISCSEISSPFDEVEGYILILRDITAVKEIEQQKETFVATLTHDLKTPVRAQIRALEMLLDEKFGELSNSQKEIIEETLNSNKYMFCMTDNLVSSYKYENNSVNIQKVSFDINNLIQRCYKELKYLADDKNQTVIFDFKCENLNLFADNLEMKRVIVNLLANAINYTQENGQIIISTKILYDAVIISFKDNGKGISQDELPKLFNKYQSFAKKFKQVGAGLGLYLSKQIVESHDGIISVESEEGKGSTFTIKLPKN